MHYSNTMPIQSHLPHPEYHGMYLIHPDPKLGIKPSQKITRNRRKKKDREKPNRGAFDSSVARWSVASAWRTMPRGYLLAEY